MDKSKKEPVILNQSHDSKLCINCGFPNRNTDTQCMYCRTSLIEDDGLINWFRQTYYVLRWRWQLKQKRDNLENKTPVYRSFGFFVLGFRELSGKLVDLGLGIVFRVPTCDDRSLPDVHPPFIQQADSSGGRRPSQEPHEFSWSGGLQGADDPGH